MPPEFLQRLNVSDEERKRLASLGAGTPLALLAMRKAAPEAFDSHLGQDRAQQIAAELHGMLTDEERERLAAPPPAARALGARLDPPATPLKAPPYDLARRDRLFQELERLRQEPDPSPATQERIRQLALELEALFKSNR